MSAIIFDDKIIGFGDPETAIAAYLKTQPVVLDYLPKSCAQWPIGTVLVIANTYYRVVEKEIPGWIGAPQMKHRAELISGVRCIPLLDPDIASFTSAKAKYLDEICKLNDVIRCLTNTLNNTQTEADELRELARRDATYMANVDEKCERMLRYIAKTTGPKNAMAIFNNTD